MTPTACENLAVETEVLCSITAQAMRLILLARNELQEGTQKPHSPFGNHFALRIIHSPRAVAFFRIASIQKAMCFSNSIPSSSAP